MRASGLPGQMGIRVMDLDQETGIAQPAASLTSNGALNASDVGLDMPAPKTRPMPSPQCL